MFLAWTTLHISSLDPSGWTELPGTRLPTSMHWSKPSWWYLAPKTASTWRWSMKPRTAVARARATTKQWWHTATYCSLLKWSMWRLILKETVAYNSTYRNVRVCVCACLSVCVFVSPCYDDAIPIMHFVQYPIIYTYLSIESIYII